ncbi:hypothetical protein GOV08_01275, partial [Candidatus Woesearchaeota archaeon]|nr:hypothetical protein [Candidatus Woesearchaeota archaeon]
MRRNKADEKVEGRFWIVPLIAVLLVAFMSGMFMFNPQFVGMTTAKENVYTQNLGVTISENSIYTIDIEEIGVLKSVMISGKIIGGEGSVRVYVEDLLVLDKELLPTNSIAAITGLTIYNDTNSTSAPIEENVTEEIVTEEDETIEIVENVTVEDNETIIVNETADVNQIIEENVSVELNKTTIENNETVQENATIEVNETIEIVENVTIETEEINQTINKTNPKENITQEEIVVEIPFENICVETCIINLDKTNLTLKVEIDNLTIIIDSITYTIEEITQENITTIQNISTEESKQGKAEVGKPVKWSKKIKLTQEKENHTLKIHKEASNITITNDLKLKKIKENKVKTKVKNNATEVEIKDKIKEATIEYYTEAPRKTEKQIGKFKKEIIISSDTHYENITASTTILQAKASMINLYRLTNGSREAVEIVEYIDNDNNELIDEIKWIVPSLSNQTYEVDIDILNIQSYPTVGGSWIVEFNTT